MAKVAEQAVNAQRAGGTTTAAVEDAGEGVPVMPEWYGSLKRFPCRAKTSRWTDSKTGEEREAKAKKPLSREWDKAATADDAKLAEWQELYPDCMWGAPTGKANGFFVVDLDSGPDHAAGVNGVEALAKYADEHGHEFPQTLSATTAGGGMHLYFKMPVDGTDIRNSAGKILPGVDVRGSGGYVIVPPSMNQDTGKAYIWDDPSQTMAEAPEWLLELVTKKEKPASSANVAQVAGPVDGVGTTYGRAALESELTKLRNTSEGSRNDTLNEVTIKLAGLAKGGELDGNEVYAAIEEAARETGLSDSEVHKTMASAWKAATPRTAPNREAGTAATMVNDGPKPGDEGFEWPEPVPFSTINLPKLTPDMLPDKFGEYCAALAEAKQVPLELAVSMALAALSAAAVAGYELEIRPGYREPPIIYTICPLEPANRKSAVCSAVMEPLIEWEKTMAEELGPEIRRANSQRKSLEKAIDHKRAEYARADPSDRDRIQREIDELEEQMPEETSLPRVLTDSVTPEALAVLMKEQGECMAILSAEGGIFDIVAGMYNKGVPNMDLFLKAWCRESYRVDRRNSDSVLLERPALVMGITAQPFTMANRTAAKAFRGRGLDGRFLYFLPESILGRRKVEPEPMNEGVKTWFSNKLKSLLPTTWGRNRPQPQTLYLSAEAYRGWLEFSEALEKELAEDGEFDGMTDWGGKLAGYVARLAELFHLASHDDPAKEKISPEIMSLASQLGAFLAEHAKAAYSLMGTDETLEGAKKIHAWIKRKHAERFTTQEVWQDLRRTFCRAPALREALTELADRFYIYEIPTEERTGPGRKPAPRYLVNPKALEA
ncbi:MAG: DUF3987 domain-containing protein [bacterium]|nr:DUF3987 domain-containing protein [bacterium]